jgi:hypothetical protein
MAMLSKEAAGASVATRVLIPGGAAVVVSKEHTASLPHFPNLVPKSKI